MYVCVYICMCVCMYLCAYVCKYAYMYVFVCIESMYRCMYVCMSFCMYVCMYICRYVCCMSEGPSYTITPTPSHTTLNPYFHLRPIIHPTIPKVTPAPLRTHTSITTPHPALLPHAQTTSVSFIYNPLYPSLLPYPLPSQFNLFLLLNSQQTTHWSTQIPHPNTYL